MALPYCPLDFGDKLVYHSKNFIGQFVTILSVNKTRTLDGRFALIFYWDGRGLRPFFLL